MQYIENRSFLIVSAKRPLAEWIAEIDKEEVNPAVEAHHSVYLVPPLDIPTDEQVEKLLERHYSAIFENELFSWITKRELWPSDRSLETFKQWFTYRYIEEGFDVSSDKIEKE